jgi:hypothetical protein
MKRFRKRFLLRSVAVFTVIVLLTDIIFPSVSYALTTGQHQPEYTSYEDSDATDMVNLLTGDFAYNMPLLTVPVGEEAGFTVPLSYHAGFGPESEASWVGLGWNVNVGALTRNINGFPDDAAGETQTIHVKDPGTKGWSATILGTTLGWDKQTGHYGVLNLGAKVGYQNGDVTSVGIAGLTVSGSTAQFNAQEFAMTVVQVVMAIATYGASEAGTWAVQLAWDLAVELAIDAVTPDYTPDIQSQGFWKFDKDVDEKLFVTEYKIWLDKTRYEDMWGTLYLDRARTQVNSDKFNMLPVKQSVNNTSVSVNRFELGSATSTYLKGSASDININQEATAYTDDTSPVALAYDNFSVGAPNISGSIKPYRMEVGSVSMPREMTEDHVRLAPVTYLPYKVPFVYDGSIGNRYFHHTGAAVGQSVTDPSFNFGVDGVVESTAGVNALRFTMNDAVFASSQRIATENNTSKRVAQGQYIEWLSNAEIASKSAGFLPSAFLDYFPGQDRAVKRNSYDFQPNVPLISINSTFTTAQVDFSSDVTPYFTANTDVDIAVQTFTNSDIPGQYNSGLYINKKVTITGVSGATIQVDRTDFNSAELLIINNAARVSIAVFGRASRSSTAIGGFSITGSNGLNYHFALPVCDYSFKSEVVNKTDDNKRSTISRAEPFANTWLLTGITGPDFVDRGGASNAPNGVIDDNDWGYWVKFNYGRNNADFEWRIPFNDYKMDYTDVRKNYATGLKEQYYLNSIETRSHTALFIKDTRLDSRSKNSKTSLRLAEIALITKDTYNAMITAGLPAATGRTDINYKVADFTGTKGTLLQGNAIRRIVFNTDYSLCPGTPNSTATGGGKLTLTSVSFLGKNNAKVFPDYLFGYGVNPAFNANQWDGWGLYTPSGTAAGNTHKSTNTNSAAWCLNKVTSPEGAVLDVVYERDTYASISGQDVYYGILYTADDTAVPTGQLSYIPTQAQTFSVGDKVRVTGYVNYKCANNSFATSPIDVQTTISSVTSGLTFSSPIVVLSSLSCPLQTNAIDYMEINVREKVDKYGGNLRVASIQLSEPGGQSFKTRYLYTASDGLSAGVVAQEPDYSQEVNYDFNEWLQYPITPVFYKNVTVLSGKLSTDEDYHTKQVFEFETPDVSQYTRGKTIVKDKVVLSEQLNGTIMRWRDFLTVHKHQIEDRTSKIGKVKSTKTYDKQNVLHASTEFVYTAEPKNNGVNNYQGIYTDGALMVDMATVQGFGTEQYTYEIKRFSKAQRTTIVHYPWTLQKVISTEDGFTTTKENKSWDLMTGMVLETINTDPLGVSTQTVLEPAYTKYTAMDSKAKNQANKNMLTQLAASYVYRLGAGGTQTGLVGGSATVWRQDWSNYRILNGTGDGYANGTDLGSGETGVWRRAESYEWKGNYARLQADGTQTFTAADKFNFATLSSNVLWQKVNTLKRYNHYSYALESQDLSGIYNASRLGYNDQLMLITGSNAKFMEIAYSGAEDRASTNFFGSEVALGAGTIVSTAHTGTKALSVNTGNGFVYKTDDLTSGSVYKAYAWTNSLNGRIYYKINGGSEVLSAAPVAQKKIGNWYLLEMNNIPYGASIEVGVKSASPGSGAILFDDFKFQPADAVALSYVYDPVTQQITHILGNDHLYTRYEYYDNGILFRTYKESFAFGEKLVGESRQNYKRFNN